MSAKLTTLIALGLLVLPLASQAKCTVNGALTVEVEDPKKPGLWKNIMSGSRFGTRAYLDRTHKKDYDLLGPPGGCGRAKLSAEKCVTKRHRVYDVGLKKHVLSEPRKTCTTAHLVGKSTKRRSSSCQKDARKKFRAAYKNWFKKEGKHFLIQIALNNACTKKIVGVRKVRWMLHTWVDLNPLGSDKERRDARLGKPERFWQTTMNFPKVSNRAMCSDGKPVARSAHLPRTMSDYEIWTHFRNTCAKDGMIFLNEGCSSQKAKWNWRTGYDLDASKLRFTCGYKNRATFGSTQWTKTKNPRDRCMMPSHIEWRWSCHRTGYKRVHCRGCTL